MKRIAQLVAGIVVCMISLNLYGKELNLACAKAEAKREANIVMERSGF